MISISLCMIVKDEEDILSRCLNSFRGIFDEIVIVDTGSTDRTKEIARSYTDKIYDYEWKNDFAAARNYAFSKASCDYIYSGDADEMLSSVNRDAFLDLKQVLLPEIDIVQMYYVNDSQYNGVYNSRKELRPKLYKRLRTFQWYSPIHETVRLDPIVYDSEIEILHRPTSDHSKRDFDIFLNTLKNNIRLEDYVLIMYCKELFLSGTDEDLLNAADYFTSLLPDTYTSHDCQVNIACIQARIYRLTGNTTLFFTTCLDIIHSEPVAEICMELGMYYLEQKMLVEAIHWFTECLSMPSVIDIRTSGILAYEYLSACYQELADLKSSIGDKNQADSMRVIATEYQQQAKDWKLPEELK